MLPHFELTSDDRIKINPLAYWNGDDVDAYRTRHDLPEHPLVGRGYKSIGCAPCTSAVADGEDPRSGRWRGRNKTECGIHFDVNGRIARPVAAREANLFKDGRFVADPWRTWAEGDAADGVAYTHVPLTVFLEHRETFLEQSPSARAARVAGRGHRVGVRRPVAVCLGCHRIPQLQRRARLFDGATPDRALWLCAAR